MFGGFSIPYAIYLRKSRTDAEAESHGEGETLSRHENALTDLAEKSGLKIIKIYREIVSGETIAARPEIQKLLSEVEMGLYEGVLVMDADRLARGDSVDQGLVARAFRLTGTKIITPRKIYDPNSEFDEEYFEFELFMARREYKLINRRIQRGRIASASEGHYICSSAPYGYDRVKIVGGKGYTLVPNNEAIIVKYIFDQYLSCGGAGKTAAELDSMGIPTRKGGLWNRATVMGILKNPVYIGKIRWSYRKNIRQSCNGCIVTMRKTSDNYILAEGLHEPIIDTNTFDKVRKKLSENCKKPVTSSNTLKNPFTGLIYCKICKSRITRLGKNSHTAYDALKCSNKRCKCISAPLSTIENSVYEALEQWFSYYEIKVEPIAEKKSGNFVNILEEMKGELLKVKSQRKKICEFLELGIYTADIFAERNESLTCLENEIQYKIKNLEELAAKEQNDNEVKSKILPHVIKLSEIYFLCIDDDEKNSFLKLLLGRIEYEKNIPNRRGHLEDSNITLDIYPQIPDQIKNVIFSP